MLSTLVELLGLLAIIAGAYILCGLGVALLTLGAMLLFVGYSAAGG